MVGMYYKVNTWLLNKVNKSITYSMCCVIYIDCPPDSQYSLHVPGKILTLARKNSIFGITKND